MNEHSFISTRLTRRSVISSKGKSGEKYHRILEAAISVFAQNGFYQSTISQIAREAGVADGTIYLYFKNKDDILVQFFSYKTKMVFDLFRVEVEKADNAIDKLNNLIRVHLKEFQGDKNMAIVYQAVTRQYSHLVNEKMKDVSKMYLDIVSDIVEQGQEEGSMRRDLYVGLVKRFVLGSVDEVINTWLHSGGKYDLATMAEPMADLLIRGIGSK